MSTIGSPESASQAEFLGWAQDQFAVLQNETTVFGLKDTACKTVIRQEQLGLDGTGTRSADSREFRILKSEVCVFAVCESLGKLFVGSKIGEVTQFRLDSGQSEFLYTQPDRIAFASCLVVDRFAVFGGDKHQVMVIDTQSKLVPRVSVRHERVTAIGAAKVYTDFPMSDQKTFVFLCGAGGRPRRGYSDLFVLNRNYARPPPQPADNSLSSIRTTCFRSTMSLHSLREDTLNSWNANSLEEVFDDIQARANREFRAQLDHKDARIRELEWELDQTRRKACHVCGEVQTQKDFLSNFFDNQLKLSVLGSRTTRFSKIRSQINKYNYYCRNFGAFLRK